MSNEKLQDFLREQHKNIKSHYWYGARIFEYKMGNFTWWSRVSIEDYKNRFYKDHRIDSLCILREIQYGFAVTSLVGLNEEIEIINAVFDWEDPDALSKAYAVIDEIDPRNFPEIEKFGKYSF